MDVKTLIIHPEKCNNCGDCETACIATHASLTSLGLSCIRILKAGGDAEDAQYGLCSRETGAAGKTVIYVR